MIVPLIATRLRSSINACLIAVIYMILMEYYIRDITLLCWKWGRHRLIDLTSCVHHAFFLAGTTFHVFQLNHSLHFCFDLKLFTRYYDWATKIC